MIQFDVAVAADHASFGLPEDAREGRDAFVEKRAPNWTCKQSVHIRAHLETRHGPSQHHARRPSPPARGLAPSIPCLAERRYSGVRDGMAASYPSIKELT